MKQLSALLPLAASLLITTAAAGSGDHTDSGSTWLQWTSSAAATPTPAPAPAASPVTWTDWVTDYITVTETNYVSVTKYITDVVSVTGYITNYISVTQTQVNTVTVPVTVPVTNYVTNVVTNVVTNTITQPPVTVTVPVTNLITNTVTVPVTNVITNTVTVPVTNVVTNAVTNTVTQAAVTVTVPVTNVVTNTVTQAAVTVTVPVTNVITNTVTQAAVTVTSVSVSVSVSTSVGVSTVTSVVTSQATVISTAPPLTGIVTCPSRIVNPTYTPPTPLPSNYLWGCPPGKLCHPKREGCNFEQNTPADTYVCAPEECLPVAQLPPLETWLDYEDVNDTCAWLTPIDDYFNINPTFFDLDFDIFNIYGQPSCSPIIPPVTETVKVPVPTTVVQVTTVLTPVKVTEYSTIVDYETVTVTTTVAGVPIVSVITQPVTQTVYVSSSGWSDWSKGPAPTPRAELVDRELAPRAAVVVAKQCYAVCDYAAAVYQSIGRVPQLCSNPGQWSSAFARVTSCTNKYTATGVTSVATVLNDPIIYCSALRKRDTPPALRFARN